MRSPRMTPKARNFPARERGAVLIIGVLVSAALLVIIMPLMLKFAGQFRDTDRGLKTLTASYLAESGIERALWELNYGEVTTWEGDDSLRSVLLSKSEWETGRIEVAVFEPDSERPWIESRGSVRFTDLMEIGRITRVELKGGLGSFLFNFGLFADHKLTYHGESYSDSYDSRLGDYDELLDGGVINKGAGGDAGTNGTVDGSIELQNVATIKGNAVAGPGSDPYEAIYLGPNSTVTGDREALEYRKDFPPVAPPDGLASIGDFRMKNGDSGVLSLSGEYSSFILDQEATLTIPAGVDLTLYITGTFVMGNGASLNIEEGATVKIYCGGTFEQKNEATINNLSKKPENLFILGTDSCEKMVWKNGGDFYGAIYSPQADIMVANSAQYFGSLVTKEILIQSSGGFHYDVALNDINIFNETGRKDYVIRSWQQGSDHKTSGFN